MEWGRTIERILVNELLFWKIKLIWPSLNKLGLFLLYASYFLVVIIRGMNMKKRKILFKLLPIVLTLVIAAGFIVFRNKDGAAAP